MPRSLRTPSAIAAAVAAEITGPSSTSRRANLTAGSYAMTPPLKYALAPGVATIRDAINPPVKDSATPSEYPLATSRAPTAASRLTSSMPKTASPRIARSAPSSTSRRSRALASSGAFTVIRTFTPSMPLARKAIVGAPGPSASRASRRGATSSERRASEMPTVRRVRETMTAGSPVRSWRSGMTARASISSISYGTPGTA